MTVSDGATFDVVVVGAGIAGRTAALRAAELRLRVLLLDKTSTDPSWSNSRLSGGIIHACHTSLYEAPGELARRLAEGSDGAARPELVEAFTQGAAGAPAWLREQGIALVKGSPEPFQDVTLDPPAQNGDGKHEWRDRGPERALGIMRARLLELGGTFSPGTRAEDLLVESGRVAGVVATRDGARVALRAPAVILADGGFQANPEFVDRYVAPGVSKKIVLRGSDSGTGDGLRMAAAVGAKLVNMQSFYGHTLSIDALRNERLRLYPTLDGVVNAALLISRQTQARFLDEGLPGVTIANYLARLEDPQCGVLVCGQEVWDTVALLKGIPANPTLEQEGATVHRASTIEDLAEKAGLDPARLRAAVDEHNRVVAGDGAGLAVPRTGQPRPLAAPPFRAIPIVPGITHTMGGVLIDPRARVLDEDERPIPGLWAVGQAAGGLDGGPRAAYAGGLAPGLVFGLLAAESIRQALERRPPDAVLVA